MSFDGNSEFAAPRWARSLLTWLAPPDRVDEVLGDLEETHRDRTRRRGRFVASLATTIESLDIAVALLRERGDRRAVDRRRARAPDPASNYARLGDWFDRARQDLSYAWRGLRRSPIFTLTVVVVLALGVGANGAVVAVLDRVFLQNPGGVHAPSELRRLYFYRPDEVARALAPTNAVYEVAMYPEYLAMRDATSGDAQLATYLRPDSVDVRVASGNAPMMVSHASRSYFDVLQVRPTLGRFFDASEDRVDVASQVAVISNALWRRRFGEDPHVIGSRLVISDRVYTVIGVAAQQFSGIDLDRAEVWLPLGAIRTPPFFARPWYQGGFGAFRVVARVSSDEAARHLVAITTVAYRRARASFGIHDTTSGVRVGPVIAALGPADRLQAESISLRLSGVSFVLFLIACANAANMLLVRATRRRREFAIRRALGMSPARLTWQLIVEGLVLSTVAGVVAAFIAVWGSTMLRDLLMPQIHWADASSRERVFAFTAVASMIAGPLAALASALRACAGDSSDALKAGSHVMRRDRAWVRTALLIGQAALSVVLLVGAGLFVRSLRNVRAIDLGFDAEGLVTATALFRAPARKAEVAPALEGVASQMAALPDVQRVAMASVAPMHGAYSMSLFVPGRDSLPRVDGTSPFIIPASPEYFATLGVRLLAGRFFDSTDRASAPRVGVVGAAMARVIWPGESALGKCIKTGRRSAPCTTIVGVVEDTHVLGVIEKQRFMQLYLPLAQSADLEADRFGAWNRVLILRTHPQAEPQIVALARRGILQRLPDVDVLRVDEMSQVLDPEMRPWRLGATLFTLMGVLAALVAAVGVYGVIAFAAGQRTHEIGVRIAIGARRSDIVRLVMNEGVRILAFGIFAGLALAIVGGRLVQSLLYGVSTRDPLVLVTACAVIGVVGLLASLLPALRASRVDPTHSLRAE